MEIFHLPITRITEEGENIKSYYFPIPEGFSWEAGSHIHVALPGFNSGISPNKELVYHMSIKTLYSEGEIAFTTRLDSSPSLFKTLLSGMKVGDKLFLFKPASILKLRRENRPLVYITMGVATATARPLFLEFKDNQEDIPKITSIVLDRKSEYTYQSEFEAINSSKLALIHLKNRTQLPSMISDLSDKENSIFYIVGSDDFVRHVISLLKLYNVKSDDIMLDMKDVKRRNFI